MQERSDIPLSLGDEKATSCLDSLAEKILKARRYGRYPLFVIGAGISRSAGVPLMPDLLTHLTYLTKSPQNLNDEGIEKIDELCQRSQKTRSRSDIAMLFSALQETRSDQREVKALWTKFCQQFLNGDILLQDQQSGAGSILLRDPTQAHSWIASMCLDYKARCLSLNFDGLTRKAINHLINKRKSKNALAPHDKCVILDSPQKLASFFGRDPERRRLCSVFKLRGDIFYAVCQTSGCPLENTRTPIYALSSPETSVGAEKLILCPECEEARNLQIAFPGYYVKEQESDEMLAMLWRHVVPNLSIIIVIGFSGEWDRSVVDFTFKVAQSQKIPVVDVRLRPLKGESHYIYNSWRENYPTVHEYIPIYGTADDFAQRMDKAIEAQTERLSPTLAKSTPRPQPGVVVISPDEIWTEKEERPSDVAANISREPDVENLQQYSQLGLKTFWWGAVENVPKHNRYKHSIGTMRVATQWHESLEQNLIEMGMTKDELARERDFLRISMLLHDYGHLPFSHLFEEIFAELHWTPLEGSSAPWHEVLTKEKIKNLFNEKLRGTNNTIHYWVEELGYDIGHVIDLIAGRFGKPHLDAIVNSPLDADKIDYLFRDLDFLKFGSTLPPDRRGWLTDFLKDQDLSPEGLVRLNGRSALHALALLETRRKLYLTFYLAPELRMMERITSHVLVCYLGHYVPSKLRERLQKGTNPFPIDIDYGPLKVELASKKILEKYETVLRPQDSESSTEPLQEVLLLESLLREMLDNPQQMDTTVIKSFKELQRRLSSFPRTSDNKKPFGSFVRSLYKDLHVAGPYYADAVSEDALREIVRELTLLYQGSVLFDVTKTPKFLAGASTRVFDRFWKSRQRVVGEAFLVPDVNPNKWTIKSRARVPLHAVDFGPLNKQYLQILIFDPNGERPESQYIHQQFLRSCAKKNISLDENSPIL